MQHSQITLCGVYSVGGDGDVGDVAESSQFGREPADSVAPSDRVGDHIHLDR